MKTLTFIFIVFILSMTHSIAQEDYIILDGEKKMGKIVIPEDMLETFQRLYDRRDMGQSANGYTFDQINKFDSQLWFIPENTADTIMYEVQNDGGITEFQTNGVTYDKVKLGGLVVGGSKYEFAPRVTANDAKLIYYKNPVIAIDGGSILTNLDNEAYIEVTRYYRLASEEEAKPIAADMLNFKKKMSAYLKDCPEVADKIANKVYRARDFETIVEQYNNCF